MSLLPSELESPIDNILLQFCEMLAPMFYATGHTANLITFEGALVYLYALQMLKHGNLAAFAIAYAIGYLSDCLDGYFARRYGMTSKFGEWFEHIRDVAVAMAYFYILFNYYDVSNTSIFLLLIFGYLLLRHLGQQQLYIGSKGGFLDILQPLAGKVGDLRKTRWFGCGTFNLLVILLPFFERRVSVSI